MTAPVPVVEPEKPRGLSLVACVIAIGALLAALPLLYFRISAEPVPTSVIGDVVEQVKSAVSGVSNAPSWYGPLRAGTVIASFLATLLAVIGLILKHSGQLAGIAIVLALGALVAASPGLGLGLVAGAALLVVVFVVLGVG